jgi:hypothetical protein
VDNNEHLSDVYGPGPDGADLPGDASSAGPLVLAEWIPKDQTDVAKLLLRYAAAPVSKDPEDVFLHHLTRRADAVFYEVGDIGLIYFTAICPGWMADFNVIFWDLKLGKERIPVIREAVQLAMDRFDLQRVTAVVPEENRALTRQLKNVGFTIEGLLRRGRMTPAGLIDITVLSVLREEAAW